MRDFAPVKLELGGVGAQTRVGLAAQELPHRGVEGLAANVPQGDVDAGDAGHDDATVAHAPEGEAVQPVPDLLVVHGVEAHDALGEVDGHAKASSLGVSVGHAHLAEARDALVGVDAHEHGVPGHVAHGHLGRDARLLEGLDDVYARDLHGLRGRPQCWTSKLPPLCSP